MVTAAILELSFSVERASDTPPIAPTTLVTPKPIAPATVITFKAPIEPFFRISPKIFPIGLAAAATPPAAAPLQIDKPVKAKAPPTAKVLVGPTEVIVLPTAPKIASFVFFETSSHFGLLGLA